MSYWGVGRLSATYSANVLSTAAASTSVVSSQVYKIRAVSDVATYISIGEEPVASAIGSAYLPANAPEYFTITPGQKVSFRQSAGTASGTAFVTEIG